MKVPNSGGFWVLILMLYPIVSAPPARSEIPEIRFGIVPQHAASRLAQIWTPLINAMSRATGLSIVFATTADIQTFEACLEKKAFQIAYMDPLQYAQASTLSGFRALARQNGRLQGIIISQSESTIDRISDLKGMKVAFPAPTAFGATILPKEVLRAVGVRITPTYVKSHDSVYRAVAAGLFPAGGGNLQTWKSLDPAIRKKLKIIHKTASYTPHAVAASAAVGNAAASNIVRALVQLNRQEPQLLAPLSIGHFQAAQDADWDDVRQLTATASHSGQSSEGRQCPFD